LLVFQIHTEVKPATFCGKRLWTWKAEFIGCGENAVRADARFVIQGVTNDLEMAHAELTDLVNLVKIRLERLGFKEVEF
jgi:hypothetical protein